MDNEQDFINDIASGRIHENDIDRYVRTNDVNSLYDYIMLEEILEHSDHLVYALRYLETKYGCSWKNETGQGTAKPHKRRRRKPDNFMEYVQPCKGHSKKEIINRLHELIDDSTEGAHIGAVLLKARTECYLNDTPNEEAYKKEFRLFCNWQNISNYFNENDNKVLSKAGSIVFLD